jgi:HEPN domain-containing protein
MTAEWVKKAENDYQGVMVFRDSNERFHDQICFFCQQCAEKYLKALLQELGEPVPRTHNLLKLQELLRPHYGSLKSLRRGLDFLTRFAIGPRYPMFDATKRQSVAAVRWTGRVREACRAILGVRPRGRRGR